MSLRSSQRNLQRTTGNLCSAVDVYPARLTSEQVAAILGFSEHDIPVLVNSKLLKPLGKPVPNAVKYFARVEIENIASDVFWLSKATQEVSNHWKARNQKKKEHLSSPEAALSAAA